MAGGRPKSAVSVHCCDGQQRYSKGWLVLLWRRQAELPTVLQKVQQQPCTSHSPLLSYSRTVVHSTPQSVHIPPPTERVQRVLHYFQPFACCCGECINSTVRTPRHLHSCKVVILRLTNSRPSSCLLCNPHLVPDASVTPPSNGDHRRVELYSLLSRTTSAQPPSR